MFVRYFVELRPAPDQGGAWGHVSILTRSSDRVQLLGRPGLDERTDGFNPHPVLGPGATACARWPCRSRRVSILTRSSDRVQPGARTAWARVTKFQSSPGPRTGCNRVPADREQVAHGSVSILTRSSDRVQPGSFLQKITAITFQSSPGPRTGCNILADVMVMATGGMFQSSPGPRTGCNSPPRPRRFSRQWCFNPHPVLGPGATGSMIVPSAAVNCFNPHPVLGPGATPRASVDARAVTMFQSSPGPRTGCNLRPRLPGVSTVVSILTRSSDRVQPQPLPRRRRARRGVSILTRSSDRVQR